MKIAITGSTGYIGSHLMAKAILSGHQVVSLSRKAPTEVECSWIPYNLNSHDEISLPSDVEVVVHLATETSQSNKINYEEEIIAAERLIYTANKIKANFIFISSQAAKSNSPTGYGRVKWNIEQKVIASGGVVVRPGQVYGGEMRGLFGELVRTVQKYYFLPAFLPSPRIQPIYIDDLISGILRLAEFSDIKRGSVVCLGSIDPISFTSFLASIANTRLKVFRIFIPLPTFLVRFAILLVNKKENGYNRLISLFELSEMVTKNDLKILKIEPISLDLGMQKHPFAIRRSLIAEGAGIFYYLSKQLPDPWVVRRYVRFVSQSSWPAPLFKNSFYRCWPALFLLTGWPLRNSTNWSNEFRLRLNAMILFAEASPRGAQLFLGNRGEECFIKSILGIIFAVSGEIIFRIFSLILFPIVNLMRYRRLE